MRRTTSLLVTVTAVLLVGCGGSPAVTIADEPTALEAVADTLSDSFVWTGQLTTDISSETRERAEAVDDHGDLELFDEFDDQRSVGAKGDDGSWRIAFVDGGTEWFDLRLGLGEVLAAETLTPDVSVLLRLDVPHIFGEYFDDPGGEAELERELAFVPPPFDVVAAAVVEGRFGGLVGEIDLAEFGVTAEDLRRAQREFVEDVAGVADRESALELLDTAVTVRDFTTEGDVTVATVDVHPRDAAFAIYDLFDDAAGLAGATRDLPETWEAVATITFDREGRLLEVTTDVLELYRLAETDRPDPVMEVLAADPDAEFTVTFGFEDHGEVSTVLDVDDAVTIEWGELADLVASMF